MKCKHKHGEGGGKGGGVARFIPTAIVLASSELNSLCPLARSEGRPLASSESDPQAQGDVGPSASR